MPDKLVPESLLDAIEMAQTRDEARDIIRRALLRARAAAFRDARIMGWSELTSRAAALEKEAEGG